MSAFMLRKVVFMTEKKKSLMKIILEYAKIVVISFVLVLIMTNFFLRPVQVSGSSMYPTLVDGELGFTNIFTLNNAGIKRFDVVVAKLDYNGDYIVKRVIGLPFDVVEFKNGLLYINDIHVEETFLNQEYVLSQSQLEVDKLFTKDYGPITLAENEYFLLGDNRLHSTDSRVFGVFTRDKILSKSVYIWFPFNSMKVVD